MATEVGKAYIPVDGDFSKFDRDARASARKAGKHFSGLGKLALAGLTGGGAAALGVFTKHAIGSASDINESLSKNQVLFGKYAKGIERFSDRSAKSIGTAKQSVLEYAGTFGNLFRALGVTEKKSARYSKRLTTLAADMASFNNTSIEEALEAIRSGLVGETEPLRRFGVNMNDATLRAEALKLGLIKNTKQALDPQTKALAAQALIVKQTSKAHGDFERTSGGLANQQRILKAKFQDVRAELGDKLLPIAKDVTTVLVDLGDDLEEIFKRKDLSFGEKINAAIKAVKLDLAPLTKQITNTLKGAELGDKVGKAIETLAPKIAEGFAHAAPRAAGAFVKAFSGADVWGRLLTLGFISAKLGLLSPTGGRFGKAGERAGKLFGRRFGLGAVLGIALVLPDLVKEFNKIKIHVKTFHGIPTGVHATYGGDTGRRGSDVAEGERAAQDLASDPSTGVKVPGTTRPSRGGGHDSGPRHQNQRKPSPRRVFGRPALPLASPHAPSGRTFRGVNIGTLNMTAPADNDPRHWIAKLDLIAAARG